MALTAAEQEFVDWVKRIIPRHYFTLSRVEELSGAFAKMFGSAQSNDIELFSQALIGNATNLPPDFLQLHALGRGTHRQENETDTDLRSRLRTVPEVVTKGALIDAVNDLLAANALPETAAIVELRYDRAFFTTNLGGSGTGGEFTTSGGFFFFEPDSPAAYILKAGEFLTISGAASAANDGTFEILGFVDDKLQMDNPSGVIGVDASVSWTTTRSNPFGVDISGRKDAYLNRGFRMTHSGLPPIIIVILPYGSTAEIANSVLELLRTKKGAGVGVIVERRLNP